MTCDWCLLCERIELVERHRVTLHGVYSAVEVPSFPWKAEALLLVARLEGTPGETASLDIVVFDPKRRPLAALENADVPIEVSGHGIFHVSFSGLPFAAPGAYRFSVRHQDAEIGGTTLTAWPQASPRGPI